MCQARLGCWAHRLYAAQWRAALLCCWREKGGNQMKTLFCQQAAEYTYEKFRENVSTAHIMIMVPGQFAEKNMHRLSLWVWLFAYPGGPDIWAWRNLSLWFFPLSITLYRSFVLVSRVFHVAIFVKECFYLVDLLFTTFCFYCSKEDQVWFKSYAMD